MKPTLTPPNCFTIIGWEERLAIIQADDIGSQIFKGCSREGGNAGYAAIHGVTAAILHAQQFLPAFVEFMVSDCRELKTHQVEGVDGRLIMEY